jgi:Tol biopolymer transport system component
MRTMKLLRVCLNVALPAGALLALGCSSSDTTTVAEPSIDAGGSQDATEAATQPDAPVQHDVNVVEVSTTDTPTDVPAVSYGEIIIYQSNRDDTAQHTNEIYAMNVGSTGEIRLTTNSDQHFEDRQPYFSADGKQIAFISNRDGVDAIYIFDRTTNATNRIPPPPSGKGDYSPAFSPNGSMIVFSSNRDSLVGHDIYTITTDSAHLLTKLTNDVVSVWDYKDPSFSPDGKKIVFSSNRDIQQVGAYEVWVMDADGKNMTQVTTSQIFSGKNDMPVFSPDGSRIAFVSTRDGNAEIYTAAAAGMNSDVKNVSNTPSATESAPFYTPSGRLLFASDRNTSGRTQIFIMDADGNNVSRLTENSGTDDYPRAASGPKFGGIR